MTLYFCLDDRGGMLFNHRRQSRDAAVLEDVRSRIDGEFWIDPISAKLMDMAQIPYIFAPEEITDPIPNVHFFVESRKPGDWVLLADTVVCYRWNRHYPGDLFFDMDLKEKGFFLYEIMDFPGKSHETITREVYVK